MNGFISAILVTVILAVVFAVARKRAEKIEKTMNTEKFTVRQPKTSLGIYIFVTVFFILIFFVGLLPSVYKIVWDVPYGRYVVTNWGGLLGFMPFLLLGPFFIILWVRYKITVRGNQMTVRTYFGRKKTFTFDYITTVKLGYRYTRTGPIEAITVFHENKKLFALTPVCPGYNVLVSCLRDKGVKFEAG